MQKFKTAYWFPRTRNMKAETEDEILEERIKAWKEVAAWQDRLRMLEMATEIDMAECFFGRGSLRELNKILGNKFDYIGKDENGNHLYIAKSLGQDPRLAYREIKEKAGHLKLRFFIPCRYPLPVDVKTAIEQANGIYRDNPFSTREKEYE